MWIWKSTPFHQENWEMETIEWILPHKNTLLIIKRTFTLVKHLWVRDRWTVHTAVICYCHICWNACDVWLVIRFGEPHEQSPQQCWQNTLYSWYRGQSSITYLLRQEVFIGKNKQRNPVKTSLYFLQTRLFMTQILDEYIWLGRRRCSA